MKIYRKRNIFYLVSIILLAAVVLSFAGKIKKLNKGSDSSEEVEACGVERWDVKVFTDAAASSINVIPVNATIDSLVHITTPFPDPDMERQPIEKQAYTIHCLLNQIKLESDGDYHLTVTDSLGNSMITEIPDPTCPSTTGSIYLGNIIQCRQFIDKYYTVTGSFQTVNRRMVITGVTFVDPPHGQTDAAPNNIELHSILNIEYEPVHTSGIAKSPEAGEGRQISIYPNPFHTETEFSLNLNGQLHQEGILKLFDLRGKEVRSITWPANEMSVVIPRGDLSNGIYLYRLTENGNEVGIGKIMAQ